MGGCVRHAEKYETRRAKSERRTGEEVRATSVGDRMALTIRICVLKRGKWCLVAKGLVKRLQSGDVRENEYHETDD